MRSKSTFGLTLGCVVLLIMSAFSLSAPSFAQTEDDPIADRQRFDLIARIGGTRWNIVLEPLYAKDTNEVLRDTITFSSNKLSSIRFAAEGYKTADVMVSIENGVPVWTALLANPLKGVVFWKGEVYGGRLEGTVSRLPLEGKIQDYRFEGEEEHDTEIAESTVEEPSDSALTQEGEQIQQDEEGDGS